MPILDIIFWLAILMCLAGQVLNSMRIIWCWPVWMIGGAVVCYQLFLGQIWQQVALQICYWILSCVGWYQWRKMDKDKR